MWTCENCVSIIVWSQSSGYWNRRNYESSAAINDLVINIIQKAKEADQLQENIDIAIFTLCLWGSTVGILQLMKVRGPIMKEKMDISEEEILDAFIQMIFNGIQK